jgi:PAXNEB protein
MSSFVKLKKDDSVEIKGVRTSIRNGKITSTGSDSFDFVIGGGIEVSSVLLIGKLCNFR